jgi:Flp pilus assembly protein TadB
MVSLRLSHLAQARMPSTPNKGKYSTTHTQRPPWHGAAPNASRQQTADSRQQTTDSRQSTAGSRQQTADTRQQAADSRQKTANSRQQTEDSTAFTRAWDTPGFHCCYTVVTLLLHCCYTVVTLLLHCCYTVVTLLLHCCYTVVTLLLPGFHVVSHVSRTRNTSCSVQ